MDAFWVCVGVVALGEMGDKTQLLAMVLAARFHRSGLICFGIFLATLLNHLLAGLVGQTIAHWFDPDILTWVLGLSFLVMAGWLLFPDRIQTLGPLRGTGILWTTILMFFLAEMGDKTQIATVALAARFDSLALVVAGSTLGMMLANVPAVYLGARLTNRLPLAWVRAGAALLFAGLGVATLLAGTSWLQ
ncbi:TMEM165/GDT1 family protein [Castellaniella sp.]|uniref:TMEM165/GDT1 family protein n=1 Tax=Castellaniella sp. TaxID=1955812 RepID=UPI00355D1F2E